MTRYLLGATKYLLPPVLVALGIAVAYFRCSPKDTNRIAVSAHSVLLASAGLYALAVAPWSSAQAEMFIGAFWALLCAFLVGLVYTFIQFRGNRRLHILQVVQIPLAIYLWFVGTMTITHDWL